MALRTIVQLSDAKGTSFTINEPDFEAVLQEFQRASAEHRLMIVGMEQPGYVHRVNPHQVAYIHQLDY